MARFVFILCPERSGSTLLSAALGGNAAVVAPPELHLLRYVDVATWRREYPAAGPSLDTLLEGARVAAPPNLDSLDTLALYRYLAAHAHTDWIVDKTPAYARSRDALQRTASLEPRYLWLVRHPLGVVASRLETRDRMRRQANRSFAARLKYPAYLAREHWRERSGASVRELARDWAEVHRRIAGFLDGRPRESSRRIHFESLVTEPERALRSVCQLLEIELAPRMLDPRANLDAPLAWGIGDQKILQQPGFQASAADAWRSRFDASALPEDIAALHRTLAADDDA